MIDLSIEFQIKELINRLVQIRKVDRVSQLDIQRYLSISQVTLSKIENCNGHGFRRLKTLNKIANYLGYRIEIRLVRK